MCVCVSVFACVHVHVTLHFKMRKDLTETTHAEAGLTGLILWVIQVCLMDFLFSKRSSHLQVSANY